MATQSQEIEEGINLGWDGEWDGIIKRIEEGDIGYVGKWLEEVTATGRDINEVVDDNDGELLNLKSTLQRNGTTALNYAAFYSQLDIVKLLLENGADPRVGNAIKENALHSAVASESDEDDICQIVEALLSTKYGTAASYIDAKLDPSFDCWTPLLSAIETDLPRTVKLLCDKGADPTINTAPEIHEEAQTSLELAARNDGQVLRYLLEREDMKERVNEICGKYTPLHQAVLYLRKENIASLLEKGADMMIPSHDGFFPIHFAKDALSNDDFNEIVEYLKHSINKQDSNERTLLHHVVILNKVEFVRILINDYNANYGLKDSLDRYPLHYLSESSGNESLVPLLANRHIITEEDKKGYSTFLRAVKLRHHKLVNVLLRAEACAVDSQEVSQQDNNRNAIHLAAVAKGSDEEFRYMMDSLKINMDFSSFEAFVNSKDGDEMTALHLALERGMYTRVELLLEEYQADPQVLSSSLHRNFIHLATVTEGTDIQFKCLICWIRSNCCSDYMNLVNGQDGSGNTALHLAVKGMLFSRMKILLEYDAVVDIECLNIAFQLNLPAKVICILLTRYLGDSPQAHELTEMMNLAIENERLEIVNFLLVKKMAKVDRDIFRNAIFEGKKDLAFNFVRHAEDINFLKEEIEAIPSASSHASSRHPSSVSPSHFPLVPSSPALSSPSSPAPSSHAPSYPARSSIPHLGETTLFNELISRMPGVAKEVLNRCMTVTVDGQLKIDYSFVDITNKKRLCSQQNRHDPLEVMVTKKRKELLQHTVVKSYIYNQWITKGFLYYSIYVVSYAFFLLFLSLFTVIVNSPVSDICRNLSNSLIVTTCGSKRDASYALSGLVIFLAIFISISRIIILFLSHFESLIKKIVKTIYEMLIYIFSIVFVSNFFTDCGCPTIWQWNIGIFVVFLAWINMLLIASEIPWIGIYVIIFKNIVLTFMKMILFSLILIVGFTFVLFMIFFDPNAQISSFSDFGLSFVKTITMETGEFGFEDIFNLGLSPEESSELRIPFFYSGIIMWIIFLVAIPILLNNMLTSLAVGDTNDIIKEAELQALSLQAGTVLNAKDVMPCWHSTRNKVTFNKIERLLILINGGYDFMVSYEEDTYTKNRDKEKKKISSMADQEK